MSATMTYGHAALLRQQHAFWLPFAANLKAARLRAGLSQRAIDHAAGYAWETAGDNCYHWEHGVRRPPWPRLRLACLRLGIAPASLFPVLRAWRTDEHGEEQDTYPGLSSGFACPGYVSLDAGWMP